MKFLRIAFLFFFSIGVLFTANAQQDSVVLKQLLDKTKRLSDEQPVEKVYLHFDKPYYAVADTIWFKAYLTIEQNLPSPLSKIVYIDVLTAKDSVVQTLKLPVKNSVAYGNIPLNMGTYKQGNYYIKAYTRWMLNFPQDYFFSRPFTIGEAIDKELNTYISFQNEKADKNIKTTVKIQFKDMGKKVHANKSVNWRIFSNYDEFVRGRGTTDQHGVLTLSVTSKNGEPITNGVIVTDLTVAEKSTSSATFNLKQRLDEMDIQFFPEGGRLINGIANQVGFKALSSNGLGLDVKGIIYDGQQNEVATFSSAHAGMGSFFLNPIANQTYTAKVTTKNGLSQTLTLPKGEEMGIALQAASHTDEFLQLKIIASEAFFEAHKGKSFFITGLNSNVIYYAATVRLQQQLIQLKVPRENFPAGIAQFTLFNNESNPLTERLLFVWHKNNLNVTIKSDLPNYKPRQKVTLNFTASFNNQPVSGDFSVAVTDEEKVPVDEQNETTIWSSLLLQSDLAGHIEQPNYYFVKTDDKKLSDLDKLMLTQGYRRFSFKEILSGRYPAVSFMPEQGISITGTLRDLTGMPVRKGALRLMVTDKPISAEIVTSNTGLFNFQNLVFPDSSQVVISAKYNPNAANLMIMVDGMPTAGPGKNPHVYEEVNNIDTVMSAYLSNSQRQYRYLRTLKEVEIKGAAPKKASHMDHPSLSGLGPIADHQIGAEVFDGCNFLLECLKARATGLTYVDQEQKFYVTRDYNSGSRIPAQVFINGTPVDARDLNSVNMAELESIQIFLRDALGTVDRLYGTRGVMVINTKKAPVGKKISKQEFLDMIPKKNVITFNPMGYSKEREFYSPKYLPNMVMTSSDLRTTIYWNPKVVTNEKGESSVEFFNADGKGNYRVVIEGFDQEGNLTRGVFRYSVK